MTKKKASRNVKKLQYADKIRVRPNVAKPWVYVAFDEFGRFSLPNPILLREIRAKAFLLGQNLAVAINKEE
ncbi:hypothetical protein CCACVL1_08455 [Corchorus capsularis]|uniref:Uncharacterized protein n=1 Tax=Corchorus capsularis TaxID=210143 RepID=A0A1R3J0J9_COCAP|nr:hypothetical protein CCACVL1_08455 [Corchorus capsularis]